MLFRRQASCSRREFRSSDLPPYSAWRHSHLWIVANAFTLAHVSAGHHIEFAVFFAEPDGSRNTHASFAKRGQRDVFLALDRGRNLTCHRSHFRSRDAGKSRNPPQFSYPQGLSPDCPDPAICVTSLNMRKWMRERLQRRKKKSDSPEGQPAPPPLQPAYFDADASEKAVPEASDRESAGEREEEVEPVREEPAAADSDSKPAAQRSGSTQRRGRRRRGGRGRGGRGREQAVAQAFTPKGNMPDVPAEEAQATAPEVAEPEVAPTDTSEAGEIAATPSPQPPAAPVVIPSAPPRPPKGIVVLAIGLPGSGKSSWFKRHNLVPLSSDMVRSLLFDDVREQRFQDLVFSNLRSMLKARLIAKRPMNYVDATNLTPQERQHWIKLAKDYNYEVHAVFFDVPLDVCIERHQRRDRVVPEDVMRRMAAKLKPPAFQEGFAKITVVRVKKKDQEQAEQAPA